MTRGSAWTPWAASRGSSPRATARRPGAPCWMRRGATPTSWRGWTAITERGARFVCCLVLLLGPDRFVAAQETVTGVIAAAPRGDERLRLRSAVPPARPGKTMAELPDEDKDRISHRGRAARQILALPRRRANGPDLHVRQRRLRAHPLLPRGGTAAAHRGRHRQSARGVLQEPGHGGPPDPRAGAEARRPARAGAPPEGGDQHRALHGAPRPRAAHHGGDPRRRGQEPVGDRAAADRLRRGRHEQRDLHRARAARTARSWTD